jgi:hypothetical protein
MTTGDTTAIGDVPQAIGDVPHVSKSDTEWQVYLPELRL